MERKGEGRKPKERREGELCTHRSFQKLAAMLLVVTVDVLLLNV